MIYDTFIFCLTKDYNKLLIEQLVNMGYLVGSPYGIGTTNTASRGIISIIGYRLNHKSNKSEDEIIKDIKLCFKNIKGYYYGVVVNNQPAFGNINGETDISRVLQMKALW